jgi:quercetin dioxygenase-like cupin family protein
MAHRGQIIENALSGERIAFRQTAAETGGELLAVDLELAPDGRVPGLHVHPTQEERFEVRSGRMRFRKGLRTVVAEAGDVVVVPPGAAHKFANVADETAVVSVEVRPALRMEELFETAAELAAEGRTTRRGLPKPLDLALFAHEFRHEVCGAFRPVWLQRVMLAPLVWLARRRGLAKRYAPAPPAAGSLRFGTGETTGDRAGATNSA